MSMPTLPTIPAIKLEEAASMIMVSIAMEEIGLSHIINAEGEKLKYVLNKVRDSNGLKPTTAEILEVNKSIKALIDSIMQSQMLLKAKLECVAEIIKDNKDCPPSPKPCPPPMPCPPEKPCIASYPGRPDQCWISGKPLLWRHTECPKHPCIPISPDGGKLILDRGKCYTISFTVDICAEYRDRIDSKLSIGVRLKEAGEYKDKFIYHAPAARTDSPETISASGIYVSTFERYWGSEQYKNEHAPELSIVLLGPEKIAVKQASISVTEL